MSKGTESCSMFYSWVKNTVNCSEQDLHWDQYSSLVQVGDPYAAHLLERQRFESISCVFSLFFPSFPVLSSLSCLSKERTVKEIKKSPKNIFKKNPKHLNGSEDKPLRHTQLSDSVTQQCNVLIISYYIKLYQLGQKSLILRKFLMIFLNQI